MMIAGTVYLAVNATCLVDGFIIGVIKRDCQCSSKQTWNTMLWKNSIIMKYL